MIAASRKPATLRELVEAGARELQWCESAARENPLQEASVLLMAAVGCERSHLVTHGGEFAPTRETERFWSLVSQRATGVPLQLLLGETGFHAVTLRVERGVFIPRPETELLVEEAVAAVRARLEVGRGSRLLDLCTGTGAVAIAVAAQFRERSDVHILAADWNPQAVRLARRNAEDNGVDAMIDVRRSNLYSALADQEGRIDVLVSNPPYVEPAVSEELPVEVRLGDPKDALFDPEGGTGFHRKIAGRGRDFLSAGGVLAMEIGATQGASVAAILAESGYGEVRVLPDLAGRDRVVRGTWTRSG
ncbi:MAG: peptide chain release factor N(5)-glutamine methyltransferase [bacterium]